jgi:hypothetical protein
MESIIPKGEQKEATALNLQYKLFKIDSYALELNKQSNSCQEAFAQFESNIVQDATPERAE